MVALGTFGASTKRKLTCELSPLCSLGGAEHIRTMHVVNKSKIAKSLIDHIFQVDKDTYRLFLFSYFGGFITRTHVSERARTHARTHTHTRARTHTLSFFLSLSLSLSLSESFLCLCLCLSLSLSLSLSLHPSSSGFFPFRIVGQYFPSLSFLYIYSRTSVANVNVHLWAV